MANLAGYGGSITLDAETYTAIKKWELTYESDLEDITGMATGSTGARAFHPTLNQWNVSAEGDWDEADSNTDLVEVGAETAVVLSDGAGTYSGTGLIKSFKPTVGVDGVVTFTVEIQGTGALV